LPVEEIVWRIGFIDKKALESFANELGKSTYADYFMKILK